MERRRADGDDRWSVAIVGAAVAVALGAAIATSIDAAAAVGRWFVASDPIVPNVALASVTAGPAALVAVLARRSHRDRMARRELARRSTHDPLTGLPNRTMLPRLVARGIRATRSGPHQCAVLFCDLDRFKAVNDTYGHEVGDQLMVAVAERLRDTVGEEHAVLRYGGDEFVIVARGLLSAIEAERLGGRVVKALELPFEVGADAVRISACVGVALSAQSGEDPAELLRDADIAMYQAKLLGPGTTCAFERSMGGRLTRATARPRLQAAVDGGEIELRYEPVLSVRDGELVAVRARLHWDGDNPHQPVRPEELRAALEGTGLVVPVGEWALGEASRQARRWRELAPHRPAVQVLVPVAARQLAHGRFRDQVARALAATGGRRDQVCLVVSGPTLAGEISDAWAMLRHLRALGVQLGLDGFGDDGSSLGDLRRALLDELVIAPALVEGLDHGGEETAIVEHLVGLAHRLGITVVASGVSSAAQLAILRRFGCDRACGPYLGTTLLASDVDLLLSGPPAPVRAAPAAAPAAQVALPRLRPVGGPADV